MRSYLLLFFLLPPLMAVEDPIQKEYEEWVEMEMYERMQDEIECRKFDDYMITGTKDQE